LHPAGDEIAQRNVVYQHEEKDVLAGAPGRRPLGHIARNHRKLGLEVKAPGIVGKPDRIDGTQEAVGASLVEHRVLPMVLWKGGAAGLADKLHMMEVGAAGHPLVGAGQGSGQLGAVEIERPGEPPLVQSCVDGLEARRGAGPVIDGGLERPGHVRNRHRPFENAVDDDERPVAPARFEGSQLHSAASSRHEST